MASLFVLAATLSLNVAPAAVALLAVLTGLAVWTNTKVLDGSRYLHLFALILAVKLGLLVYQVNFRNLPLSGVDWKYYHRFGSQVAQEANGDVLHILTNSDWDLFTRLTGTVYSLFGADSEQMYFFVFITSLMTFRFIYGAAEILLRDRLSAQRVALLFMAWPNEVVLSVTFLREMPIQMLVAASLYCFLRFWRDRHLIHVALAIILSLAATLMHSGVIAVPVAYAYLAIRAKNRGGLQIVRTAAFAVTMFLLLSSPAAAPLLAKFGDLSDVGSILDDAQGSADAAEATTYYLNPALESWVQLPYRFVMFALSPLPWQATSPGTAIAVLVEGLPRLFMVYMLVACYRRCRTGKPGTDTLLFGVLATIVASYVIFSLGVSTYGTAMRHRAKLFPLEIILVYASLAAGRQRSYIRSTGELERDHRHPSQRGVL
ncbi:glycosyltransferase family 39 protein [Aestuariimicrobium sp. Y1814]|uniref:glycosyltransferase family 39 protein n=1 Tax=Aestuariimicrobium sp. Y1814 TaxID=3418742 RepID=UPI003DA73BD4